MKVYITADCEGITGDTTYWDDLLPGLSTDMQNR